MACTDIAVIVVLTMFVANGAYHGLLRSLVGPLCLTSSIAGYYVFLATHDISTGLVVSVLCPILLGWALNTLINKWLNAAPNQIMLPSRIGGAAVNFVWGGTFIALPLLLFTLLPTNISSLGTIRKDVIVSKTYLLLEEITFGNNKLPSPAADCPTGACAISQAAVDALAADKEIRELQADERVQNIINDPAIRAAIEKHNIAQLLNNPAIIDILGDPAFLAKILKVSPKIRMKLSL